MSELIVSLFGIAIVIGALVLIVMFFKGIPWIAENVHPWTVKAAKIDLFFVVPACLVLTFFPKGKQLGGLGFVLSSYVIGFSLWVWSLIVAYSLAGVFWTIVGVLLAEIGVIPVAIIAATLKAQWLTAGQLLLGSCFVYILHNVGTSLVQFPDVEL